jgi:hypothetical protein
VRSLAELFAAAAARMQAQIDAPTTAGNLGETLNRTVADGSSCIGASADCLRRIHNLGHAGRR